MKRTCALKTMEEPGWIDDESLIARVADGQIEMLGELYERHSPMVKRALRRSTPEMPDAVVDELAQEVFIVLFDNAGRYKSQMKAKAYLYGIAVKKASSWRRNTWLRRRLLHQARKEIPLFFASSETSPARSAELRETVSQALARLPEKQRAVLILHSVEGFSGDEISRILAISPKTVRTRLFRARQRLVENVNRDTWIGVLRRTEE